MIHLNGGIANMNRISCGWAIIPAWLSKKIWNHQPRWCFFNRIGSWLFPKGSGFVKWLNPSFRCYFIKMKKHDLTEVLLWWHHISLCCARLTAILLDSTLVLRSCDGLSVKNCTQTTTTGIWNLEFLFLRKGRLQWNVALDASFTTW